jgi:hypothetical protein
MAIILVIPQIDSGPRYTLVVCYILLFISCRYGVNPIFASGITQERLTPHQDVLMPHQQFRMGMVRVNLFRAGNFQTDSLRTRQTCVLDPAQLYVIRCFFVIIRLSYPQETDLTVDEIVAGAQRFIAVVRQYKPRIVCFVGMGIWTKFLRFMQIANLLQPPCANSADGTPNASYPQEKKERPKGPPTPVKGKLASLVPAEALMKYTITHCREPNPGSTLSLTAGE